MNLKALILPAINSLIWGLLAWGGFDGEKGVEARVGWVSLGQVEWYVAFPLLMLSVSVIPGALLSQTKWHRIGNIWSGLSLLVLLPYGCAYTGGM